ncbi:apolipoprotein N-acyltransferase [Candidatus Puniceispirillum sp.]|nr:apolipoprotein N-acyltransferase [Candidatus Puniceispirillum sp.]
MPQPNKSNKKVSSLFWHGLAGAVASLSLPPLFLLPAIFALSIPFLGYVQAKSRWEAALIFGSAGFGWFLASTYWVSNSLIVESLSNWFLMPLMALALALILAIFWAVSAACSWSFGRRPMARLLWVLVFFSLGEWGRGFIATGFPWNLTGSLFSVDLASLQAASIIGIYGLCVIALAFAAVPAFWAIGYRGLAVICVLLPLSMAMGGAVRLSNDSLSKTLSSARPEVRLVQPAIPQAEKWDHLKRQNHLKRLIKLSKGDGIAPKLIIWPETAFAGFPNHNAELLERTVREATPSQGTLITGIPRLGSERTLLNSAVMIDHGGKTKGVYDKKHLVPFGEYMPFREWMPFLNPIVGELDFTAGQNNGLMRQEKVGTIQLLICYEVIFSGKVITSTMRPDLMVNITNDAWFGVSAGPWQHLAQAQMRAVEEGVPLFRVANTGITAGFDSYGRVLGLIPIGAKGILDLAVPPAITPTAFARFGNLGFFCLVILIAATAAWLDLRRSIRQ